MKILIATGNPHKFKELMHILPAKLKNGTPIEYVSLADCKGLTLPPETGNTLEDNAEIKAVYAARESGLPAVSFNFKYGASTIIHDGRNGLLADQDDTAAFTRALSRMMADEALRQACGREAVAMSARFSRENVFKQWLEVIKR